MKRLNKRVKMASENITIEDAYKEMFIDWINSSDFPSLSKSYLQDLCWSDDIQEACEDLDVEEEYDFDSEHSMYYDEFSGDYTIACDMDDLGLPDTEAVAVEDVLEYLGYDIDDEVDNDILEDEVCEYLSDEYGYLIKGYNASVDGDYIAVTNIEWEVDDEEEYLEAETHVDYHINLCKMSDGSIAIILDVYPEMKTDEGTFVVSDGFTVYGNSKDFTAMAKEAASAKKDIIADYIELC